MNDKEIKNYMSNNMVSAEHPHGHMVFLMTQKAHPCYVFAGYIHFSSLVLDCCFSGIAAYEFGFESMSIFLF
jgi:hypothetical protein